MKNTLLLFLSLSLGCHAPKEVIINPVTKEKVVGFGKDCKYQIGETQKSSLNPELLADLRKDSLGLSFNYGWNNVDTDTLLAAWCAGNKYIVSKGLKIGDPIEKALQLYGKPIATDLLYWEDEEHRFRMEFEGLFYKNLAILINTSKDHSVSGICLGRQFPLDKKYRIKSNWYKY